MSVYHKEKPEFLKEAMDSMFNQTVITNDFVLVCDGPLTKELDEIIEIEQKKHKNILNVVRLDENRGLGNALNEGLKHCKNNLVARMDSDDISCENRCEKQLVVFNSKPNISICSGNIAEFYTNKNKIQTIRKLAEKHKDIVRMSKFRNPFNHMATMFKKDDVINAGGYQHFQLLEDYYLWIRMLSDGAIAYNIQDILVYVRTGDNMYMRRGGLKYANSQKELNKYMLNIHWINFFQYLENDLIRLIISVAPNRIRKLIYENILRTRAK